MLLVDNLVNVKEGIQVSMGGVELSTGVADVPNH